MFLAALPLSAYCTCTEEGECNSWFKVKLKNDNPEPSVGLVPASYLVEYPPVRRVKAVFDYAPVRLDSGEFENEEEMEIVEGESLDLLIEEGDWSLVAKTSGTPAVGFVPSNYIEVCLSYSIGSQ